MVMKPVEHVEHGSYNAFVIVIYKYKPILYDINVRKKDI